MNLQHLKGQNKQAATYFERKASLYLCRCDEILTGLNSQLNDMSQIQPAEAKKTKRQSAKSCKKCTKSKLSI